MSFKWKNAVVPDQPEEVKDKSSRSQRKYKVRFQSDIREAKRRKARHDAPEMAASPALMNESGGHKTLSVMSRPSQVDGKIIETAAEKTDGMPLAAMTHDASLLYSFTEAAQEGQAGGLPGGMSELSELPDVSPEQQMQLPEFNPLASEDSSQADHLDPGPPGPPVPAGPPSAMEDLPTPTTTSPQLTFQADILPNIPRQLPFSSTWSQGRSEKRLYLQYYIERVVPRLMPLWNTSDNPFVSIVIPASTESEILMHAIIALSSYHLSVQPSSDGRDDMAKNGYYHQHRRQHHRPLDSGHSGHSVEVLRHKQKVLTLLRENLAKPDVLRDDATLAACMLMQTFEVLFCGTSGWDHWLKGATLLLRLRGRLEGDLKDANSWIRLAKCVVAIETFASTSTRFELLISEEYWNIYRRIREDYLQSMALGESVRLHEHEHSEDEHFEKLIGCPVVVVYSLGRMAMLRQSREEVEAAQAAQAAQAAHGNSGLLSSSSMASPSSSSSTTAAAAATAATAATVESSSAGADPDWHNTWSIESIKLEHLLFRWRPRETTPDRAHLTEAFRQAALVFYYRKIRRLDYAHETVQHHVQRTFRHLEQISPASDVENISLWPTMMAAIEIDEARNTTLTQVAIRRIRGMGRNIRDPLYKNAENALNLMWSRRREATSWEAKAAVDWDELSREMDWQWCFV